MESIPVSAALLRSLSNLKRTVDVRAEEAAWNSGERETLAARKEPIIQSFNFSRLIRRRLGRKWQRSPDRIASMHRKRKLAGCGNLPDTIRCFYTQGEVAALTVIGLEIKRHGICDFAVDAIAAKAGVCRTTVQNAMRQARVRGHIHVELRPCAGKKNRTNIVTIISNEWILWIKRGPSRPQLLTGFNLFHPTKSKDKKEGKAETLRPFNQAAPPEAATARRFGGR